MRIGDSPTVFHDDAQRHGAEPEGTLRAELLVQLLHAQADITAQLGELRQSNAGSDIVALAEGQLLQLVSVQQRLASGSVTVASLRAEVSAAVAQAVSVTQQAKAAASEATRSGSPLDRARADAQLAVEDFTDAYFHKRIFEPYLQFGSAEEEAAYRQREADRERAIAAARAEGTPEGDARATALAKDQLLDAGAHGADRSPDYQPMLDRLDRAKGNLEIAASAEAKAQPAAAAVVDPLDDIAAAPTDPAVMAAFRQAGVVVADQSAKGHGVMLATIEPGSRGMA